jgi:hypothetical protein
MTIRLFLVATACGGITLGAVSFSTWQSASKDRQKLQAAIAAQQQVIAQLNSQEHARSVDLQATTKQIEALKRRISRPDEAVRNLPQYLQLPTPITPIPNDESATGRTNASANAQPSEPPLKPTPPLSDHSGPASPPHLPQNSGFYLPSNDAKPLFDFVQNSRLCDLQLSSTRSDLQDERAKSADLAHERDQAVRATKNEPLIPRLKRDAKWLLIGAALTLAASRHIDPK